MLLPGGCVPWARAGRGFTLLEVVVALSVFAVGMFAVVGLFAPVARSVGNSSDAEAATRVAGALRTKLQSMPFADVVALLKTSNGAKHALTDADAKPDYNPATDAQIIFASRDGSKVGVYNDAVWKDAQGRNSDREKFFEIALVRNESVLPLPVAPTTPSDTTTPTEGETAPPPDPLTTSAIVGYVARLRWPAFVSDGGTGAIQVGANPAGAVRFDPSSKQVMFFSGAISR
jgi:prepilin-type N-terminal cleavage/methylation domain-containing protein